MKSAQTIKKNKGFLEILGLITVVQIALTYLGGVIFRCHGLNVKEWAVVIVMSISIIPIDLIRKAIFAAVNKKKN